MLKLGIEPMITLSHYELPIHLTLKYRGWYSREMIDFYVKYCRVIFERYKGKVKYWIPVNEINLIMQESFNHLGIPSDLVDNVMEAKFQALHNELVAISKVSQMAKEIDSENLKSVLASSMKSLSGLELTNRLDSLRSCNVYIVTVPKLVP